MGMSIVKVACNFALVQVKEAIRPAQLAVESKGGCTLLQWAIHMALEARPN